MGLTIGELKFFKNKAFMNFFRNARVKISTKFYMSKIICSKQKVSKRKSSKHKIFSIFSNISFYMCSYLSIFKPSSKINIDRNISSYFS